LESKTYKKRQEFFCLLRPLAGIQRSWSENQEIITFQDHALIEFETRRRFHALRVN
jgi:hypothetical protein